VGVVRAEAALEQLRGNVDSLRVELSAAIKGDGFRPVLVDDLNEPVGKIMHGVAPGDGTEGAVTVETELRPRQAVRCVDCRSKLGPFGADAAEVGGRVLHAADSHRVSWL